MQNRIKELEENIKKARHAYYNTDKPIVSDAVYDAWFDELKKLDPNNKQIISVGAQIISEWKKVIHKIPMGSLDKVNTPEEVRDWIIKRIDEVEKLKKKSEIFVTEKLDGLSIEVIYEDGKFKDAVTRGDSIIGESIGSNVIRMNGIHKNLPIDITCILRGEIILRKSNHLKYFSDYSNPRNAASGICKRFDGKGSEHLDVIFYQLITNEINFETETSSFDFMRRMLKLQVPNYYMGDNFVCSNGFSTGKQFAIDSAKSVERIWHDYQKGLLDKLDWCLDGLVIKINRISLQDSLGSTNMRPKGAVAFKFVDEMIETTIKDIIWQVGNTGRITPVAIFDEVIIGGAKIEKASVHNYSMIKELKLDIGTKVLVKRANQVIPQIAETVKSTGVIVDYPKICPVCKSVTKFEGEYLVCTNSISCSAQAAGRIKNWVNVLNILEVGETLIDNLIESGKVKDIPDLYELSEKDFASLPRMAEKSAQNVYKKLHESKEITLEEFIGGLSIPMIGKTIAGLIISAGYDTIDKMSRAKFTDIAAIYGIGDIKAEKFCEGIKLNRDLIIRLLKHIKIKEKKGFLKGKSFCFTGAMKNKRDVLEKMVIDNGGSVKDSVSKDLTYLVISDVNSTSSKAVKAKKFGTKLVSEEEFLKAFE